MERTENLSPIGEPEHPYRTVPLDNGHWAYIWCSGARRYAGQCACGWRGREHVGSCARMAAQADVWAHEMDYGFGSIAREGNVCGIVHIGPYDQDKTYWKNPS